MTIGSTAATARARVRPSDRVLGGGRRHCSNDSPVQPDLSDAVRVDPVGLHDLQGTRSARADSRRTTIERTGRPPPSQERCSHRCTVRFRRGLRPRSDHDLPSKTAKGMTTPSRAARRRRTRNRRLAAASATASRHRPIAIACAGVYSRRSTRSRHETPPKRALEAAEIRTLVERFLETLKRKEPVAAASFHTPDGVAESPCTGR